MDLVGEILAKEPLVSRLVAAQALDVLEVEGGGLVFEKLVSLCGGSKCVYFYWSIVITVTVTIVAVVVHTSRCLWHVILSFSRNRRRAPAQQEPATIEPTGGGT